MGGSIRFFTGASSSDAPTNGSSRRKKFGLRTRQGLKPTGENNSTSTFSSPSTPPKKTTKSLTPSSVASTVSTGGESSSHLSFDDFSASSLSPSDPPCSCSRCRSADGNDSLSRRLIVQMTEELWTASPRQGEPVALIRFPRERDEIVLLRADGESWGVILPTLAENGGYEYEVYAFEPCARRQDDLTTCPVQISSSPAFLYARIYAKKQLGTGDCPCFDFTCQMSNRRYTADKILWSTFQSRAFCIKEITSTAIQRNRSATLLTASAARITCLSPTSREVLVYPTVDPMLMIAFVAVMEEVVLVSNL